MDDTQGSRMSDAVATRKRRSSILKNQRPPRTPFSELEFKVATPTDTAKSRRVSFSRRTDVAEFVTNEATTTWKTMYVEQNRSLESSGNDSVVHPPRPTVCHLGKRIFDQQFQEVEAVDYGAIPSTNPRVHEMNASLMNVNFTQQIADLECDAKYLPTQKHELSSFTEDRSKLFTDMTAPSSGLSSKIDVNFSVVQPVGSTCDDLDEIQRDLQRSQSLRRPFADSPDASDYIEVDLNTTHVGLKQDPLDMSITDTISSPNVKGASVTDIAKHEPKLDWTADKENIAINPYVAPKESVNFAVNEIPDQVLVFDGRKLTVQTERDVSIKEVGCQQTSDGPQAAQRKTIVLNVNDDLPNFIDDASLLGHVHGLSTSRIEHRNTTDAPNPQPAFNLAPNSYKTVIYDGNDTGNVSVTQAVPTNILEKERRKTIVFESDAGELSMTQALSTHLALPNGVMSKNKTVIYGGDDISFTQALPAKVFTDGGEKLSGNLEISFTQALPNNIIVSNNFNEPNRRNTTVYGNDAGDISITRVLPSNIIVDEKRKTDDALVTESRDGGHLRTNKSIVYERGGCDISMTEAVPKNIILSNAIKSNDTRIVHEDITETKIIQTNVVGFGGLLEKSVNDQFNVSETRMLRTNIVEFDRTLEKCTREVDKNDKTLKSSQGETIANMSMTEAIPANVLLSNILEKRKTIDAANNIRDVSIIKCLPKNTTFEKSALHTDLDDFSITQAVPDNIVILNALPNANDPENTLHIKDGVLGDILSNIKQTDGIISKRHSFKVDLCKSNVNMSITQVIQTDDLENSLQRSQVLNVVSNKVCDQVTDDVSIANVKQTDDLLKDIQSVDEKVYKNNTLPISNDISMKFKQGKCEASSSNKSMSKRHNDDDVNKDGLNKEASNGNILDGLCKGPVVSNVDVSEMSKRVCENSELDTTENPLLNKNPQQIFGGEQESSINCKNGTQSIRTALEKSITEKNYQDIFVYQAVTEHYVSKQMMNVEGNYNVPQTAMNQSTKLSDMASPTERHEEEFSIRKTMDASRTSQKPRKSILSELLKMSDESIDISEYDPDEHVDEKNANCVTRTGENLEKMKSNNTFEVLRSDFDLQDHRKSQGQTANNSLFTEKNCHVSNKTSDELECSTGKPSKKSLDDSLSDTDPQSRDQANSSKAENLETCKTNETAPLPSSNVEVSEAKSVLERIENNCANTERHYDSVVSVNFECSKLNGTQKQSEEMTRIEKVTEGYKEADDTKGLLDMLSDFTDRTMVKQSEDPPTEKVEARISAHENSDNLEPKHLSLAKSRMSIVLSREDLLTNISLAHAALQQARTDTDESDDDTLDDTPGEIEQIDVVDLVDEMYQADEVEQVDEVDRAVAEIAPRRKSVRASTEVVKTLHFDDSANDAILKSNEKLSPLRKSVRGDVSREMESKARVIPSYLTDVSDDVKSLMQDLVKPTEVPFGGTPEKSTKGHSSTRSVDIQANIITSSQIDIDMEAEFNIISADTKTNSDDVKDEPIPSLDSKKESTSIVEIDGMNISRQSERNESVVLVFDHDNPLNNVVLPQGETDVHKYRPEKSDDEMTIKDKPNSTFMKNVLEKDTDEVNVRRVSTHYNINTSGVKITSRQEIVVHESIVQDNSPLNSDSVQEKSIKDTEVNTLIAMKCNRELLEETSCLTLVDDDEPEPILVEDTGVEFEQAEEKTVAELVHSDENCAKTSPLRVIFKLDETCKDNYTSSIALDTEDGSKPKKRIYSPAKRSEKVAHSSPDVTPKPLSKIQKLSNSPKPNKGTAKRPSVKMDTTSSSAGEKLLVGKQKFDGTVIVQHLTECKMKPKLEEESKKTFDSVKSEHTSCSIFEAETVSHKDTTSDVRTCSSVAVKEVQCTSSASTATKEVGCTQSDPTPLNWSAKLDQAESKMSADCESSDDLLAKIDALPFMGGHDCEWDCCDVGTWRFRLMRGRLRLSVVLKHVRSAGTRARVHVHGRSHVRGHVRADTPVLSATIELAHEDADPLARTCARLACEAMRYECVRVVGAASVSPSESANVSASESVSANVSASACVVPSLLRRCVAVARLARRWARVMRDARAHLAYTISGDGALALKVANIALHSVYEVTLRVELVVEDAREAAWARAGRVKVRDVTRCHAQGAVRHAGDVTGHVGDAESDHARDVQRILARVPHDWSHVPRTIWKVFRHLKNKTKDDELLGI